MSHTIPPTVDPLRLSHCGGCGYALNGLPDVGVCPECGKPYDQETVVLHGWARGSHANLANASSRSCSGFASDGLNHFGLPIAHDGWEETQLDAADPVDTERPLALAALDESAAMPPASPRQPAGCVEIDQVALNAALTRKRQLTPWTQLDRIEIDRIDGERHRLRIGKRPNWFGLAPALAVDAEVQCTDEQAEALYRRIIAWRDDAAACVPTSRPQGINRAPAEGAVARIDSANEL